ncbi:P-loop containing nucleoside triphosphate hydrolase protein [Collybia nuda]|uniref:P-loop containing nucleoside triphosphate hydrolase protein n=1 Tax=Collybia nuda TaxID=64659 RepID=A0A9P5YIA0_9AGAR|nr:P-loop containing nucleoside triphosphate hydrolase protein [Collybia nuda]
MESSAFFYQDPSYFDNIFRTLSTITDGTRESIWYHEHAIPVYVSGVSAAIIIGRALVTSSYTNHLLARFGLVDKHDRTPQTQQASHIQAHGGRFIFAMEILRLIGCLELLRISVSRFLTIQGPTAAILGTACVAFAYSTLLALFVMINPTPSTVISHHLTTVLASSWTVYFVRDVVPLMTYTQNPADPLYMLWELVGILSIIAIVIPLVTPRQYVPFDPSDPMLPNPEQTASPLSLLLFGFLDATVWKAYKVPHLPLADLPPLADSDHSKNLIRAAFPHLDPYLDDNPDTKNGIARPSRKKSRHRSFFWAVMFVFRNEIAIITLILLSYTAATLLSPYGLKKLLEYMGNNGEGATVKPWVWIVSLFLAPFTSTLMLQQYQKMLTRITVRLEAILTQLILKHALRIRVVAESTQETPRSTSPSTAASTAAASPSGSSTPSERNDAASTSTAVDSAAASPPATADPNAEKSKSLVGKMNNLISSDMQAIGQAAEFMQVFLAGPLLILLTIGFLYTILGWSALVGFGVLLAQMPIPALFTRWLQKAAREVAKKTDDRVETVTETMSVIRMIKMFGWEGKMSKQIDEKREIELNWVLWNKIYSLSTLNFHFIIPAVTMCSTFSFYAIGMKRTLDAATVFSSIALFDILRNHTARLFMFVPMIVKGQVSLQRVGDFLESTELLDEFSEDQGGEYINSSDDHKIEIGFGAAAFSWSDESAAGAATPSKRRFRLHIDDELIFKNNCVNLIMGPTGSGKTSLLMALLGEMHFLPRGPNSWFNLPRGGGVAYASQESWVTNATIRENIIFGSPFDQERYDAVIYQCALTRDLELFNAGDHTEVGERGLTLSGGQKARVTLARAVYSSAEILLLDDVFAALDVHTARWIVDKCFHGELIKDRTVLLVAHNVKMVASISDFVVSLGSDGQILSQGSISDALEKNLSLKLEVAAEIELQEKAEEVVDSQQVDVQKEAEGKLIVEEEVAEGHISWASIKMYLVALGGDHWILFWFVFSTATFFECAIEILQPWLLGAWATQYQELPPEEVNVSFYLTGYIGLVLLMLFVFSCNQLILTMGALRASNLLHKRLINSILGTTLRWLDKTPTSRVITRVTQDVAAVDTKIPDNFSFLFEIGVIIIVRFVAILFYTPKVGMLGIIIFFMGGTVGNIYMKSQLSIKREMSKAKAPVLAHFGASIEGLVSIRAYGAQNAVLLKSLKNVDNYTRSSKVFNDLTRWIGIRVDALGGWFAASLGWYFVYGPKTGISTSNSAFTLTMAVGFGRMVLMFVQIFNLFEVNGNSLERLLEYMEIEQEPKPSEHGLPPAHWPSSGDLRVEKLSAKYSLDGPVVLHDVSFHLKSGERVGVVGRTGSGKSSLTLSLLRCIVTNGEVFYGGLPTSTLNLDALRSQVTIIPQVPELLSGTIRRNLDPFDQFDDALLNGALRDAGLYSTQTEDDDSRITLDSAVARGGSNLSVGQRQIIALARAMVRESKLLILDEATSAIDYKTDAVIQQSLRNELKKDVTIITVAHRLQTIMDSDKIMVLDAGRIVEFDHPSQLLKNENGFFRSLVDESGDKDALYAAAGA